jgi:hypothetical protein
MKLLDFLYYFISVDLYWANDSWGLITAKCTYVYIVTRLS